MDSGQNQAQGILGLETRRPARGGGEKANKSLRTGLPNIQGLMSERTNKLASPEFINIYEKHDILLLNETWPSDLSHVSIDDFVCIIFNRTEKKLGTR